MTTINPNPVRVPRCAPEDLDHAAPSGVGADRTLPAIIWTVAPEGLDAAGAYFNSASPITSPLASLLAARIRADITHERVRLTLEGLTRGTWDSGATTSRELFDAPAEHTIIRDGRRVWWHVDAPAHHWAASFEIYHDDNGVEHAVLRYARADAITAAVPGLSARRIDPPAILSTSRLEAIPASHT